MVVDGAVYHRRPHALQGRLKLGLEKVPVHVAKGLTPDQVRAYRIADNKTAELAAWDYDLLPIELSQLRRPGVRPAAARVRRGRAGQAARTRRKGRPDRSGRSARAAGRSDHAAGRPVDLGEHRLLCGDSGNPEHVDRLLDGATIHLVNTDPPYNVKVEPRSNNAIAAGLQSFQGTQASSEVRRRTSPREGEADAEEVRPKDRPLENDFVSDEEFDRCCWRGSATSRASLPGRSFYIWGGYANLGNYPPVAASVRLVFLQAIIWDKQHPVLTRKDFHRVLRDGVLWLEGRAAHRSSGPTTCPDLWHVKKIPPQKLEHLTGKPAELAVRAIQYSSRHGRERVGPVRWQRLDTDRRRADGRRAFLMEMDPLYCERSATASNVSLACPPCSNAPANRRSR